MRYFFITVFCFNFVMEICYIDFYTLIDHNIKFLTNWGNTLTFVYLLLITKTKADKKLTHRFSFLFHLALSMEFAITLFYWAFIFDITELEHNYELYLAVFKHLCPFLILLYELLTNRILLFKNSIIPAIAFIVCYMINYFIWVRIFDHKIYSLMTFRTKACFCYMFCAILLVIFGWILFFNIQK